MWTGRLTPFYAIQQKYNNAGSQCHGEIPNPQLQASLTEFKVLKQHLRGTSKKNPSWKRFKNPPQTVREKKKKSAAKTPELQLVLTVTGFTEQLSTSEPQLRHKPSHPVFTVTLLTFMMIFNSRSELLWRTCCFWNTKCLCYSIFQKLLQSQGGISGETGSESIMEVHRSLFKEHAHKSMYLSKPTNNCRSPANQSYAKAIPLPHFLLFQAICLHMFCRRA